MAFTTTPWSSPEDDLSAEDYAKVCLIDMNTAGKTPVKSMMSLPVKSTPDGPYNVNGIHAAAAALAGARGGLKGVSPAEKAKAARKLVSLYQQMGQQAPDMMYRMAGMKMPAMKKS